MATFLETKQQILEDLFPQGNSSLIDTAVSRAVIAAQKFFENKRFWFNEDNTAIVTQSGIDSYSLGPTYLQLDSVIINDQGRRTATHKPWASFNTLNYSNFTGKPYFYSTYAEKIHFYPVPDSSLTVSISFHKKFNDLPGSASGSSTNRWLQDGLELIKNRASIDVLEKSMRDFQLAQIYRIRELELLDRFTDRSDTIQSTGGSVGYL